MPNQPRSIVRWTARQIIRVLACSAALGLLAGCVNLQAVTAYTAAAGAVVSDTRAAARWQQSEQRLLSLRRPEDREDVCTLGRSARAPQAEFDAAFNQVAAVHALLGDYFQALGALASDKLPSPSAALGGSLSAVKDAGVPVSAADEAALKGLAALLGRALDAYRKKEVAQLIVQTHDDVDRSLALLQRLAGLYADEVKGEQAQARLYWRCQLSPNGEVVDKYWGRRESKRVMDGYGADLAALDAYAKALARVRKDHAELRFKLALSGGALKSALDELSATRSELDAAHAALARL